MFVKSNTTIHWADWAALAGALMFAGAYVTVAGHFTRHMILHIGLMTLLAPLLARQAQRWHNTDRWMERPAFLVAATVAQLLLFFVWHSPPGVGLMMASPWAGALMQVSLLLIAVCFWSGVLHHTVGHLWRSILALLVTGKLFCLVALILVFAPRVLYPATGHPVALADQQLAGLLMITVCPLTYVLAAVLLVVRWLRILGDDNPVAERR